MTRSDRFDFTLDEETEKRLYDILTDVDTRTINRVWITDKRGYRAEYVKVIRCRECKHSVDYYNDGECYCKRENLDYIGNWNYYCAYSKRR